MTVSIKKLLVSQPKPETEKSPYYDIAERYGVDINFRPFIKVEPLSAKEFRQQRSRSDLEDEVGNTAVHVEYNALLWKLRSRRSIWNFSYQYEGSYELAFA